MLLLLLQYTIVTKYVLIFCHIFPIVFAAIEETQQNESPLAVGGIEDDFMNTPCGPIQLSLYEVTKMKKDVLGKTIEFDKIFNLNHSALEICGVEFHFGYGFQIMICETYSRKYGELLCTYEMDPEFELDNNGNIRIKERRFLKYGEIISNIKLMISYHIETVKLLDKAGSEMSTKLSLREIMQNVVNGILRKGQLDFPRIVEVPSKSEGAIQYRIDLPEGENELITLPEGFESVGKWNDFAYYMRSLDAKITKSRPRRNPLCCGSAPSKNEKESANCECEVADKAELLYDKLAGMSGYRSEHSVGPYAFGNYNLVHKNCVDFNADFAELLSPSQQCKWPPPMKHPKTGKAIRFTTKVSQTFSLKSLGKTTN